MALPLRALMTSAWLVIAPAVLGAVDDAVRKSADERQLSTQSTNTMKLKLTFNEKTVTATLIDSARRGILSPCSR